MTSKTMYCSASNLTPYMTQRRKGSDPIPYSDFTVCWILFRIQILLYVGSFSELRFYSMSDPFPYSDFTLCRIRFRIQILLYVGSFSVFRFYSSDPIPYSDFTLCRIRFRIQILLYVGSGSVN